MRKIYSMKKILLLALLVCCLPVFAQEPSHNLGKSLRQIRQEFPGVQKQGKTEGGDLWIAIDEDEYQVYVNYFDIRDGKVFTESMMVETSGMMENAGYYFFIISVQNYYNRGGWEECDVDASILGAANVFRREHRLVWADSFEADFDFSDFWVYFQYNQEKGYTMMTFYPREKETGFEV